MTNTTEQGKTLTSFPAVVNNCVVQRIILAALLLAVSALVIPLQGMLGNASAFASASASDNEAPRAEINKPAPDFTLSDLNGKTHSLHDYKGKIVVLEWFNPDCPFVKASHTKGPLKTQGNKVSENKNIIWLAINSGAPGKQGTGLEHNKRMKKQYNMNYPILLDESGKVGRLYGARKTPHMFIIDEKGILRYQGAIDNDPFAEKTAKGEKTTNFVELALKALQEGTKINTPQTRPYGCTVKYGRKPTKKSG